MTSDLITLLANVALTLSFIIGLIFGVVQVKAANRDRRERLTLETLRSFETREFSELIVYITTVQMPPTYEKWQALGKEERVQFIQFAQQMESLGLLLAEHLINIDLVDKTLGSLVITAWKKYKPLFLDMRQRQPDPFLGEYFQWIAEQMHYRMKENPRKPFYESHQKAD